MFVLQVLTGEDWSQCHGTFRAAVCECLDPTVGPRPGRSDGNLQYVKVALRMVKRGPW